MLISKLKGFTLIELMIVVAILGIMAAAAMPTFQDYVIRGQIKEGVQLADSLKQSITTYYQKYQQFPTNNEAAGLPKAEHLIGNYVTRIEVQDGAIHIHLGNRINRHVHEKVLSLRPAYVAANPAAPMSWLCGHANPVPGMKAQGENKTSVPPMYLSLDCRAWQAQTVNP